MKWFHVFLTSSARWGSPTSLTLYPGKEFLVLIKQQAGCAPEPIWKLWKIYKSPSLPQIDTRFLGRPTRGLVPRMSETPELCHSKSPLSVDLLECNAHIKVKITATLQVFIGIRAVGCVFKPCSRQIFSCTFLHLQGGFGTVEALWYTVGPILSVFVFRDIVIRRFMNM